MFEFRSCGLLMARVYSGVIAQEFYAWLCDRGYAVRVQEIKDESPPH